VKNGNYIETNLTINNLNIEQNITPKRGDLILTENKLIIYYSKNIEPLKNGIIIGNCYGSGAIYYFPQKQDKTITFNVDCHSYLSYNDLGNYKTLYFGETLSGYKNVNIELHSNKLLYSTPIIGLSLDNPSKSKNVELLFECEDVYLAYFVKCQLISFKQKQGKYFKLFEVIPGCRNGILLSNSVFYILNENDKFNENGTLIRYQKSHNDTYTPVQKKKNASLENYFDNY